MKKAIFAVLVFILGLMLSGCEKKTYEYALVTDVGTISDQSFNQAAWEGLKKFGDEFGKTYHYYQPTCTGSGCEVQDADRIRAIDNAVKAGAKVIVMPGYLFGSIIDQMADKYPNVKFIGIDVSSNNPKDNVKGIFFKDYESGFLAGYAIVKDGKTNIGFMGGQAVPAVVQYGIGYIAGSMLAAKENNITNFKFPEDRYTYLNDFQPKDTHKTLATTWYNSGVEVIFACAGGAGLSVHDAAKDTNKLMIGVDVDQSFLEKVVTSAMKNIADAVYEELVAIKDDKFQSGTITKGVKEGGSGLPMKNSRFTSFNQTQYDTITNKIKNGEITVPSTYDELVTFLTNLGYSAGDYPSRGLVDPQQ